VDPVEDPPLLRKSGMVENRTWDLWVGSQELWPLDYRGGPLTSTENDIRISFYTLTILTDVSRGFL
jgi:hypothetical protein